MAKEVADPFLDFAKFFYQTDWHEQPLRITNGVSTEQKVITGNELGTDSRRADPSLSMRDSVHISAVTPPECKAALELIFAAIAPELRNQQIAATYQQASAGLVSLDGLLVARDGAELVGAVWVSQLPGRTAAIWPARTVPRESVPLALRLLQSADDYLVARRVRLAQCVVEVDCGPDVDILRVAGYEHAADLLYMASTVDVFPESPPGQGLHFERYQPEGERRMANILAQTYQGTLDCPALDGVRSNDDVLTGYRATGDAASNHWYFIRDKIGDVGCLLLTDHSKDSQWELIYVGFIPASRGKAWGLEATRYAQWLTRQAGRERLVLAVDAANHPALRMYALAGFSAWDRRSVFQKVFSPLDALTC